MAFDLGGIGSAAFGWASGLVFWAILIVGLFLVFIGILSIRKRMRFEFPAMEVISLGQGKVRVNVSKCGWFKKKKMFFGLIDYGGEEEMLFKAKFMQKPRRIFYASSTDYHDIGGKRGIICKRKDDDPEILVPLDKMEISNLGILGRIAPADYRDAANIILEDKRKETLSWWDENKSTVLMISTLIFAIIALIFIIQFAQGESSAWREALVQQCNSQLGQSP